METLSAAATLLFQMPPSLAPPFRLSRAVRMALADLRSRHSEIAAAALKHVVKMETTAALIINDAAYFTAKAEAEAALREARGDWTAEKYLSEPNGKMMVDAAINSLRAIDRPVKSAQELQRLTPPGVEDRRLEVMASALAYFGVSSFCFVDAVSKHVDHFMLRCFSGALATAADDDTLSPLPTLVFKNPLKPS